MRYAADHYWKRLWTDANCVVQIWLEKAALEGVIQEVTHEYDVPLMVARGYGSLSFLHKAAMDLDSKRPTHIYYLGDHDPSGENAGDVTEERLRKLAPIDPNRHAPALRTASTGKHQIVSSFRMATPHSELEMFTIMLCFY